MDSMANESVSSFCVRCWISGRIAEIVTYFSADTCTVTSLKKASEPSTLPPAACTSCLLGEDPFASSRSRCHRWAFAAPLHAQPCHVWSSTECPLPESAYFWLFKCFALLGGHAQPVITCERMSPVKSSEPQLFLLGDALILLSHTN